MTMYDTRSPIVRQMVVWPASIVVKFLPIAWDSNSGQKKESYNVCSSIIGRKSVVGAMADCDNKEIYR